MVFSEKQSLLIGINQKAIGVKKNPKPINIFPSYHQPNVKANTSVSVMNETDSNLEQSPITYHSINSTDDDKTIPMQNSNLSPKHFSTNRTVEDTNQMMNGTEAYLDNLETKSWENVMRTNEQPILSNINVTAIVDNITRDKNNTSISKNELSEDN